MKPTASRLTPIGEKLLRLALLPNHAESRYRHYSLSKVSGQESFSVCHFSQNRDKREREAMDCGDALRV